MRITPIRCLTDNYAYLLECEETNESCLVDASEAAPILRALELLGRVGDASPKAIWATHHHHDHVGGNAELASRWQDAGGPPFPVLGHASDRGRLPAQSRFLESGDSFTLGKLRVLAHHIPGHTLGAIAYVVKDPTGAAAVFTGDTMFVAGCGRLFEGTPEQMHASLSWLAALDPETGVYCGHEYTESNLRFARSVEPGNRDIDAAQSGAKAALAAGKPTVPSTIGMERRTNPFLRAASEAVRASVGVPAGASDVTAFAAVRKAKDEFR